MLSGTLRKPQLCLAQSRDSARPVCAFLSPEPGTRASSQEAGLPGPAAGHWQTSLTGSFLSPGSGTSWALEFRSPVLESWPPPQWAAPSCPFLTPSQDSRVGQAKLPELRNEDLPHPGPQDPQAYGMCAGLGVSIHAPRDRCREDDHWNPGQSQRD